tara:strand:+ start:1991 stop:2119 length:129 start_codon:yes stop_codon:yes gene_type:complete
MTEENKPVHTPEEHGPGAPLSDESQKGLEIESMLDFLSLYGE